MTKGQQECVGEGREVCGPSRAHLALGPREENLSGLSQVKPLPQAGYFMGSRASRIQLQAKTPSCTACMQIHTHTHTQRQTDIGAQRHTTDTHGHTHPPLPKPCRKIGVTRQGNTHSQKSVAYPESCHTGGPQWARGSGRQLPQPSGPPCRLPTRQPSISLVKLWYWLRN